MRYLLLLLLLLLLQALPPIEGPPADDQPPPEITHFPLMNIPSADSAATDCFMNTAIQILRFFPKLEAFFKDYHTRFADEGTLFIEENDRRRILVEIGWLFKQKWTKANNDNFRDTIGKHMSHFRKNHPSFPDQYRNDQESVEDFLRVLMDAEPELERYFAFRAKRHFFCTNPACPQKTWEEEVQKETILSVKVLDDGPQNLNELLQKFRPGIEKDVKQLFDDVHGINALTYENAVAVVPKGLFNDHDEHTCTHCNTKGTVKDYVSYDLSPPSHLLIRIESFTYIGQLEDAEGNDTDGYRKYSGGYYNLDLDEVQIGDEKWVPRSAAFRNNFSPIRGHYFACVRSEKEKWWLIDDAADIRKRDLGLDPDVSGAEGYPVLLALRHASKELKPIGEFMESGEGMQIWGRERRRCAFRILDRRHLHACGGG